ncbi:DivIVA domain-containing protein [bacterium]|nr:DivIVA domain-containing protein [bacterium]
MKLTPEDITHQEFRRSMRGYSVEEVTAFLEVVAENYSELERENKSLHQRIKQSTEDIEKLRQLITEQEKTIREYKNDLAKVDRMMDAKIDTEVALQNAQTEASKILETARQKAAAIENDLKYLKEQKAKTAKQLKEYLLSQLAVLEIVDEKADESSQSSATILPTHTEESLTKKPSTSTEEIDINSLAISKKTNTEQAANDGIREFLSGIQIDDIPDELANAIESLNRSGEELEEKKKKVLEDLEKLNRNATSMFRKADLREMLGDDASKKAEDLINEIHSELEKKKHKPE